METLEHIRNKILLYRNVFLERLDMVDGAAAVVAEALVESQTIRTLSLEGLDDDSFVTIARGLANNTSLNHLMIAGKDDNSDESLMALMHALESNWTLTSFDLAWCHNDVDQAARALTETMRLNTSLKCLALCDNTDNQRLACAVAVGLLANRSLREVGFILDEIGEAWEAIKTAIQVNASVETLSFSFGGNAGAENATIIAEALQANKTLLEFEMNASNIQDSGAKAIANVLREHLTLKTLNLRVNKICLEGTRAITEALHVNRMLTSLDLNDNEIGDEGARLVAEALKSNTTLQELSLNDNHIEDGGAAAIAAALQVNTSLSMLHLAGNEIRNEGVVAIAESLKVNKSLTQVFLVNNEFGREGVVALMDALRQNAVLLLVWFLSPELESGLEGTRVQGWLERNLLFHQAQESLMVIPSRPLLGKVATYLTSKGEAGLSTLFWTLSKHLNAVIDAE